MEGPCDGSKERESSRPEKKERLVLVLHSFLPLGWMMEASKEERTGQ
jgi:hypothetical protein